MTSSRLPAASDASKALVLFGESISRLSDKMPRGRQAHDQLHDSDGLTVLHREGRAPHGGFLSMYSGKPIQPDFLNRKRFDQPILSHDYGSRTAILPQPGHVAAQKIPFISKYLVSA